MAINLVHRKDLDDRVERLAARLGLSGRGRKTAIIERVLTVLEEQVAHSRPRRADIEASLNRYIRAGRDCARDTATAANGRCRRPCRKLSTMIGACRGDRSGYLGDPGNPPGGGRGASVS